MNRRLVLAVLAVGFLVVLAGCTALFGGVSDDDLDENATYDDLTDRDSDVVIDLESGNFISSGEFRAVYDLNNTDSLELYRSGIYNDVALEITGVRYWYPNGTELTGTELEIDQGQSSTDVQVPDGNGTLAFTGTAGSKSFDLPAFVDGSYEIMVPEGHRTTNFLVGSANPSGYDREVTDDREHLTWDELDSSISLQYYLPRDIWLFGGLVIIAVTIGGAGAAYVYRQIKHLREQREELGLDVDIEDDSRDGPPPGL